MGLKEVLYKISFRHHFNSRENWVPVQPKFDQLIVPEEERLINENRVYEKERDSTYYDIDICCLRMTKGERVLRALKLQWYEGCLNIFIPAYRINMDIWYLDKIKYNTQKFNADIDLITQNSQKMKNLKLVIFSVKKVLLNQ